MLNELLQDTDPYSIQHIHLISRRLVVSQKVFFIYLYIPAFLLVAQCLNTSAFKNKIAGEKLVQILIILQPFVTLTVTKEILFKLPVFSLCFGNQGNG